MCLLGPRATYCTILSLCTIYWPAWVATFPPSLVKLTCWGSADVPILVGRREGHALLWNRDRSKLRILKNNLDCRNDLYVTAKADKSRPQGSRRAAEADRRWWQCHVIGSDLCRLQRTVAFSVTLFSTSLFSGFASSDLTWSQILNILDRMDQFKRTGSVRNGTMKVETA